MGEQPVPLAFAAIGLDHRHIYEMVGRLLELGCRCKGWWTLDEPQPLAGFRERYPDLVRVDDRRRLLDDPEVRLVLTAAPNDERAAVAIEAMRHGKDVMTDKPGCVSLDQLAELRRVQAETGRIWSVNFSERFEVRSVSRAIELVRAGAIGKVVHTTGLGPHRLNRHLRPRWFFERPRYGGILTDIGSHQIDQFLAFTGATDARIETARVANLANPDEPGFQDFGEMLLRAGEASGYVRVDWFTPDGLPTWGDGRLVVLGTEGYLELRKYVDLDGRPGGDHLFLVDRGGVQRIDCTGEELPYYRQLVADVLERTERAMPQAHAFAATELALRAQALAEQPDTAA